MILKDMETTPTYQHTGLLFCYLPDSDGLGLEQRTRGFIMLLTVILCLIHIGTIEVGEIIAPQGIAGGDALHGILYDRNALGHFIQDLLIEQFDIEATCQLCSNLMSACTKLAADGYHELFFSIHSAPFLLVKH